MEVSDLLDKARIKLADPLADDGSDSRCLFTTVELLYYINNALREAVFRGRMLVKGTFAINALTDISEYKVPSGAINIIQILDENNHDVVKIQEVDFAQKTFNGFDDNLGSSLYRNDWRNDTDDLPTHFIQNANTNKLRLYPIPTKDSVLQVRATYFTGDVDEVDDIPSALPEFYQRDLMYWVLFEAYDKKDAETYEGDEAEKNKNRFTEIFGEKLTPDQFQEMLSFPDDAGSLRDY